MYFINEILMPEIEFTHLLTMQNLSKLPASMRR